MANAKIINIQLGKTTELNIFENEFKSGKDAIHGTICIGSYLYIKIIMRKGKNGWFVCYPSYKDKDGDYKDLVFATKAFNETIIKKFEENLKFYGTPTTNDIETAEDVPF